RPHRKRDVRSSRRYPTSVALLVESNYTKAAVTLTCQTVAKSHKSRHVFVTVGREYPKKLAHLCDSHPQRVKRLSLLFHHRRG
ncbi:hypothetical protein AVEN_193046-1, partial [Araneus ventricosus]